MVPNIKFKNTYSKLPNVFFEKVIPTAVKDPSLIILNDTLCNHLNLNSSELQSEIGIKILSGNFIPENAEPISMVYGGHQFGHWVPQLGDGRAILLGEIEDKNNINYDIQLKGSGITPYSRNGDGRSPLGPVIREYILSESMHYLGIPTTRALSVISTGEFVLRDNILPGGILTRVARTHIRIGTFQYFYARKDYESLNILTNYVIERYFKNKIMSGNYALKLLKNVLEKQAKLIAKWQSIGFVHGVMNTDNTSIFGETIDYGPCAFLDHYNPNACFSSIDRQGRYSFQNQPSIAQWNITMLANCLIPLIDKSENKAVDTAKKTISEFPDIYNKYYYKYMRKKIGLRKQREEDIKIIDDLLNIMEKDKLDFTLTFSSLKSFLSNTYNKELFFNSLIKNKKINNWILKWKARLDLENKPNTEIIKKLLKTNPQLIPRNHNIENIISEASNNSNYELLKQYIKCIKNPYNDKNTPQIFLTPPSNINNNYKTFCGT